MTEDELKQARDRADEGQRLANRIDQLSELSGLICLETVRVQVNVQRTDAKIEVYHNDPATGIVTFGGAYIASGSAERLRKALRELVHDDLTEARIAFEEL